MATRYLKSETNGRVFVWTPALHARSDMRIIGEAEAKAGIAELEAEAKARAERFEAGEDDNPDLQTPAASALTVDALLAITDKNALEATGRANGIELDKRKSVKTLQSELIQALGLS